MSDAYKTSQYYEMVDALFRLPLVFHIEGHPQQTDFLFISNQSGIPLLYRWHDGKAELIAPDNEPVVGQVALHPSKPLVALGRDTNGNEDYAIYLLDYTTQQMQRITPGSLGRVSYLFWSGEDSWVVVGNDQQSVYVRQLYRDGSVRDVFTTTQQILTGDYDARRNWVVVSVGRGPGTELAILDVTKADAPRWISESDQSEDVVPSVNAGYGLLAYATDGPPPALVVRSLDSLEQIARFEVPGEVEWITGKLQWLDELRLCAVVTQHGRLSPRLLDMRTGEWTDLVEDGSGWNLTMTKAGLTWVDTSFTQPPEVRGLRNGGVATVIPGVTTPGAQRQITSESVWYPSFDGRQVQGWLLRNADPSAPLVVYCHGGPTFMAGNWWQPDMQALLLAGYHVFAPNFRGSISFGPEFKNLNMGDLGGGDLQDVLYGARHAAQRLGIRMKPAIVGASYGGYLVLQALTTQPDQWAGGVAIAPIADWIASYEHADAHFHQYMLHFFGGAPEEKADLYRERSPITHLEKLRAPLLILHGQNDPRCPLAPVERFAAEARQRDLPVRLVVAQDEGHGALKNVNAIRDTVLTLEHLRACYSVESISQQP